MTTGTLTSVTALFVDPSTKNVLAVSRRGQPENLGLVGGSISPGETPEQAVIREVLEETGVRLLEFEAVFERSDVLPDERAPGWELVEWPPVCRCYRVTKYEGMPEAKEPGFWVGWVPPARLLEPSCIFAHYNKALFIHVGLL